MPRRSIGLPPGSRGFCRSGWSIRCGISACACCYLQRIGRVQCYCRCGRRGQGRRWLVCLHRRAVCQWGGPPSMGSCRQVSGYWQLACLHRRVARPGGRAAELGGAGCWRRLADCVDAGIRCGCRSVAVWVLSSPRLGQLGWRGTRPTSPAGALGSRAGCGMSLRVPSWHVHVQVWWLVCTKPFLCA